MKIIITEEQKKKLFIPRKLNPEDSRYTHHNNSQPIKNIDGKDIRINQYDYEGRKQGYWEDYYINGQLYYKGSYKNDKRDGYWEYYYDNGQLSYKGSFKNDIMEGYWERYYENGQLWFKGSYKNGDRYGYWEEYLENGELRYRGSYVNGKFIKDLNESEKKKLFIPRKLSKDDSRYTEHNNSQPIKNIDGKEVRINQYDYDGRKQGYWEEYYDNGKLWYKGSFKNGLKEGMWEFYHNNGQLWYKGPYKNGNREGYWEGYYDNGELWSKSSYKNLNESIRFSDVTTVSSSFKTLESGERNIAWIELNDANNILKSYIFNSIKKNDFGYIIVREHPLKPLIVYRNGYRGQAEELYSIAKKYGGYLAWNATYDDSKRIGELLEYNPQDIQNYLNKNYSNRQLKESEKKKLFIPRRLSKDDSRYTDHNNKQPIKNIDGKEIRINQYDYDGRKQGYWEEYYINGQLWSKGSYKNGNMEGYWVKYYSNGELRYKGTYKNGLMEGYWEEYYDNGKLWYKGSYKNDKRDGYWEYYYEDGQLEYRGSYKNGLEEGYWEEYYYNGQLKSKGFHKNDIMEGYWGYYNNFDGDIYNKNGEFVGYLDINKKKGVK